MDVQRTNTASLVIGHEEESVRSPAATAAAAASSAVRKMKSPQAVPKRPRPKNLSHVRPPPASIPFSSASEGTSRDERDALSPGATSCSSQCKDSVSSLTPRKTQQSSNVKVLLRVRPFTSLERARGAHSSDVVMEPSGDTLEVTQKQKAHSFPFDHILWSAHEQCPEGTKVATQLDVFHKAGLPVIDAVLNGFNTCIFAYGQTGSGKTHTIMGEGAHPQKCTNREHDIPRPTPLAVGSSGDEQKGLLPRIVEALFKTAQGFPDSKSAVFEVSFMEIYCEKVKDLLENAPSSSFSTPPASPSPATRTASTNNLALLSMSRSASTPTSPGLSVGRETDYRSLKVRKHPVKGVFVEGVKKEVVSNWGQCSKLIAEGMKHRVTAATSMNETSSRSHAIFSMTMTVTEKQELSNGKAASCHRTSCVHLVDLAGSERSSRTGAKGQLLEEANQINLSLTVLRKVIDALVERSTKGTTTLPPLRESMLTWVLSDSLGGNSKTTMIATASPAAESLEETISTLRYAVKARAIVNTTKVNESSHTRVVRELQMEIAKLKEEELQRSNCAGHLQEQITLYEGALEEVKRLTANMAVTHKKQLEEERRKRSAVQEENAMLAARLRAAELSVLQKEEAIATLQLSHRPPLLATEHQSSSNLETSCTMCALM